MKDYAFFLGGRDLEMVTIRQLLADSGQANVCDHGLTWGASASQYRELIGSQLNAGRVIVLIELRIDFDVLCQAGNDTSKVVIIDHHNERAGHDADTSLHQVFSLLQLPEDQWTRHLELVAANDRGHTAGMKSIGASSEEMKLIRDLDRQSQGITTEQEESGCAALLHAQLMLGGRLAVVDLPHSRSASVTDANVREFGGPGYENLLIRSPCSTQFFGNGRAIGFLKSAIRGGWSGGSLPELGFWGHEPAIHDEALKVIMNSMTTLPSSEIPVQVFHHTVVWPLLLRGEPVGDGPELNRWVEVFERQTWIDRTIPTSLETTHDLFSREQSNGFTYEQVVYFHPFVRDFWFGDGETPLKDRGVRRLVRGDLHRLHVSMSEGASVELQVERTELFLCKPRVALLVVEVSNCLRDPNTAWDKKFLKPLALNTVQDFQDKFRRAYPPFWKDKLAKGATISTPGLCPTDVKWQLGREQFPTLEEKRRINSEPKQFKEFTSKGAEPPVFAHWQLFFGKLRPAETQGDIKGKAPNPQLPRNLCLCDERDAHLAYQQIMDERMPTMTYIAVADPSQISEGDYDRLTFADSSGTDPYPYEKAFLDQTRPSYSYDRFRHYGTRYLCSGYSFTVVGRSDLQYKQPFFCGPIRDHFRSHYLQMGLIAHYQRAALLYFADEISSAKKFATGFDPDEELRSPKFRQHVSIIQMQYLKFRTRAYFPEITNQLQGRELFDLWFRQLETQKLFDIVDSSSEKLHGLLTDHRSKELEELAAKGLPFGAGVALTSLWLAGLSVTSSGVAIGFSRKWVAGTSVVALFTGAAMWMMITNLKRILRFLSGR